MFRVWWTSGQSWKKNSCSRMGIFKGLKGDLIKMVAGAGFEPTTFGLWARRATRLLHPESNGSVLIITLFSVFARNYKKKSEFMYFCRFFIRKHWYSRLGRNGKTEIISQDRQRFRMCFYYSVEVHPQTPYLSTGLGRFSVWEHFRKEIQGHMKKRYAPGRKMINDSCQ